MQWYEVAFDRLYPILYGHRDAGEAQRVVESFGGLFAGLDPVLDLACGNGRYLQAFSTQGISVWGMDLSAFLLEDAVDNQGHSGRVVRGDMRRLPFGAASMGAVINMFTSFGYFVTDVDNLVVFQEISRVLQPGGLFLFDFINAGRVIRNLGGATTRTEGSYRIDEDRRLEEDNKFLVKHVVATSAVDDMRTEYSEKLRLYTANELTTMIKSAGMSVSGVFGDYDKKTFDERESERVIMVCEKHR